jgi:hypothetical protein
VNECGRTVSHELSLRIVALATIRGRPRRSRANPARRTSTSTVELPLFDTRTAVLAEPFRVTCAGDAVSRSEGRVVPTEVGTISMSGSRLARRVIVRSP